MTFGGPPETRFWAPLTSLWFLDDGRVAVTLVTRPEGPGSPAPGWPNSSSPFRLHAEIIAAPSGEALSVPEWPSNSRYAVIAAANDRGFVTETGQTLTLVSNDLRLLKKLSLPDPPVPKRDMTYERCWRPVASWSGRHVLFTGDLFGPGQWLWADAEELRILEVPQSAPIRGLVVAGDSMELGAQAVAATGAPSLNLSSNILDASFVGADLIYVRVGSLNPSAFNGAILERLDGSEVFRQGALGKGRWPGRAAVSRSGTRFVVVVEQLKGNHAALDMGGYRMVKNLLVYDRPFLKSSYSLEVRDSKLRNVSHLALSPDGRRLALLSDNPLLLEVFDLPPAR